MIGLRSGIYSCLTTSGGFLDSQLGKTGLDRFGHTAQRFDFLNVCPGAIHQGLRERSTKYDPSQGINHFAHPVSF